ncbi:hypothetical protein LOTGIDRAFT_239031 [Lottia gigantea]|uniref:ATR-interacting protein n=1 Tax=Lottia gigantea TaxID=225164 RepID=V4A3P5_LOTGI|nr:hypothetical protein LOTGIDRAFT_239031 [Lottia gigantea]ESO98513.1 hypothetical protein LOTGIDRAFT_239031 [Lottia gigantea]
MASTQPTSSKRKPDSVSSTGSREPADKRQRLEDEWDDDDDEFCLSQADIHNIDVMSSQALAVDPNVGARPSSSDTTFRTPKSTLSLRKQTSSSSSNSYVSVNGSDSYPSSNDSYRRSHSSSSLSSHSSSNGVNTTPLSASGVRDTLQLELDKWRTQCQKISDQKKSFEQEICMKDGEIKNLRTKLTQKDSELNNLRSESHLKSEEHKVYQSEKEKNLKSNCEKLETRLQFRENEYSELEEKCRLLEHRLQLLQTTSPKKSSTPTKSQRSPKPTRLAVTTSPRPVRGQFPTSETFRSDERPEQASTSRVSVQPSTSATTSTSENVSETGPQRIRRCPLTSTVSSVEVSYTGYIIITVEVSYTGVYYYYSRIEVSYTGYIIITVEVTGGQLVCKLLDNEVSSSGDITDRGVIGVLQIPTINPVLQSLQFNRDQTNLLLPLKSRKPSGNKTETTTETKPIVDSEHYHMAVHGLQLLLNDMNSCDQPDFNEPAVLILPLLSDYFNHYISMLNLNEDNPVLNSPTNSSSFKSSSCESSIESLTSSLGLLLKDGASYAQNIENLTSTALTVLKHLVISSTSVRGSLIPRLDPVPEDQRRHHQATNPISTEESSGMETDTTASLFTSLSSTVYHKITSSNILQTVIQLATPSLDSSVFNSTIVRQAIDVLTALARKTTASQLDSLACLTGILNNCLHCGTNSGILISVLQLMMALIQLDKIRSILTSQSESCPLSSLYQLTVKQLDITKPERLHLNKKIVEFLLNFCCYRNGVSSLTETTCMCSAELTRASVLVTHCVYEDYLQSSDDRLIDVIKQGLQLLHVQWLYDNNVLTNRELHTEYISAHLLTSLLNLFQKDESKYENEKTLWSENTGTYSGPFWHIWMGA